MARKWLLLLALPAAAALAAAGVAIAGAVSSGAQAASATFSATTVSNAKLLTCSVNGGDTYAATVATYRGTASSTDARLNGNLWIRARSILDTTTGLGRVVGVFKIGSTGKNTVHGTIDAVLANGGASGLATGRVRGPGGQLIATLAASFDPALGFSSGSLGTGSVTGSGVVLSGVCAHGKLHPLSWLHRHLQPHPPHKGH